MNAMLIKSENRNDFELMKIIAKRIGVEFDVIDSDDYEDELLGKLMEESKADEIVDVDDFVSSLRNEVNNY